MSDSEVMGWFHSSGYRVKISAGSNLSCGCAVFYKSSVALMAFFCDDEGPLFLFFGKSAFQCGVSLRSYPESGKGAFFRIMSWEWSIRFRRPCYVGISIRFLIVAWIGRDQMLRTLQIIAPRLWLAFFMSVVLLMCGAVCTRQIGLSPGLGPMVPLPLGLI